MGCFIFTPDSNDSKGNPTAGLFYVFSIFEFANNLSKSWCPSFVLHCMYVLQKKPLIGSSLIQVDLLDK